MGGEFPLSTNYCLLNSEKGGLVISFELVRAEYPPYLSYPRKRVSRKVEMKSNIMCMCS